jgi:hypothetical protein
MNNLSCQNSGDIGVQHRDCVELYDYNAVGDSNTHSFAFPTGPHGMVLIDPKFTDPTRSISTSIPSGLSVRDQLAWLRAQVHQKFGLQPGSPVIDAGAVFSDVERATSGTAPDLGAIEAD